MNSILTKSTKYIVASALLVYLAVLPIDLAAVRYSRTEVTGIDQQTVREAFSPLLKQQKMPTSARVQSGSGTFEVDVEYTVDWDLQESVEKLYARYKPDYGAFTAIDAQTGEVLVYVHFVKDKADDVRGHLALNPSFPAASVFKVITAAAALDLETIEPKSIIPYNGKSTSLYKKQVLSHTNNKWTRKPTLTKAFASSVNPVFARLGVYELGLDNLESYAHKFGFNVTNLASDVSIPLGSSNIDADDWTLAEVASGYTRRNTLSPIHGAMIAGAAVNEGRIATPFWVRSLTDQSGWPVYIAEHDQLDPPVSPETADKLRVLMRETVKKGSARRPFSGFSKEYDADVGGKTGSLTGADPKGRTEWFVGYVDAGSERVGYASVTVSKEKWTVKPAYVARKFIESYIDKLEQAEQQESGQQVAEGESG